MQRRLIVHIGLEKTGSTSIQNFLMDNRSTLLRAGVLYPTHNRGFYKNNHAPLAGAYLDAGQTDFTMTRSHLSREHVLRSLRREIGRSAGGDLLLSAEHFSSRFTTPQIARLAADFADFETSIVVVVRDHASRLFSSHATHVDAGGEATLDQFAASLLQPDNRYLRVKDTLSLWEQVFGRDRIHVIDYDRHADIVPVFAARCLPLMPTTARRSQRDKVALKPSATEALRLANGAIARRQGHDATGLPRWLQRRYFQRRVAARIAQVSRACTDERCHLALDHLAALSRIAEDDRRWLDEQHGIRVEPASVADAAAPLGTAGAPRAAHLSSEIVSDVGPLRWAFSEVLVRIANVVGRLRR